MRMTVVVGVDGSPSSLEAVRLAALEATWRRSPLRIVHAFIWPLMHVPLGPSPAGPEDGGLRHDAERLLGEARTMAEKAGQALEISTEIVTGAAVPVLLRSAEEAALIVLGDRGLGGFSGLLVGSVAVQLASHSPVPVLVAKGTVDRPGPVVVGVDGAPWAAPALECAFTEAEHRRAELLALHAWIGPTSLGPGDMLLPVYDVAQTEDEEQRLLAEAMAGYGERFPNVRVRQTTLLAHAAKALIKESETAGVVVVGSRGRGGFKGLLLGSVSQQVLHHAHCPVMIVPNAQR